MKLLIDTHAYMWWALDPGKLSPDATEVLSQPHNDIYVSVVSLWEMAIKINLGKLAIPVSLQEFEEKLCEENNVQTLPLVAAHVHAHATLAGIHRDPFDRMLVAQAIVEGFVLVTQDTFIRQYGVATIW